MIHHNPHEATIIATRSMDYSLSKRTDFEGPASGGVLREEGPASGWTAMVRAIAVFCFLRSRPEGSSADWDSFCRFGAMSKSISLHARTVGCRLSTGPVRRGRLVDGGASSSCNRREADRPGGHILVAGFYRVAKRSNLTYMRRPNCSMVNDPGYVADEKVCIRMR